jgi:hypothetical protein
LNKTKRKAWYLSHALFFFFALLFEIEIEFQFQNAWLGVAWVGHKWGTGTATEIAHSGCGAGGMLFL